MYLQFIDDDDGCECEVDADVAFAVPLSTEHSASELIGSTFELTGQQYSLESVPGDISSFNSESLNGLELTFAEVQGGEVMATATLSGASAIVGVNLNLATGVRSVEYRPSVNDGEIEGVVSVEDDGAIRIDLSDKDNESEAFLRGYIAENGNLLLSLSATTPESGLGVQDGPNEGTEVTVTSAQLGFVLGVKKP